MKSALIIVNLQNDYCDYCNIFDIIPKINLIRSKFDYVIFVKDWYSKTHIRFRKYSVRIPCIQNTVGAQLNSGLIIQNNDYIINKGTLELYDSDSAFYNAKTINKQTNLNIIISENQINKLYFVGALPENIIFSTVLDAVKFKHECVILKDLCVGLNQEKITKGYNYLETLGVKIIESDKIE